MTFQPYDRIQILALDSVPWKLLLPLAEEGTMPALAKFLHHAVFGPLRSTRPPHTAPAWTTFLTGCRPGRHGVLDFVAYDPRSCRFRFHDGTVWRERNLFAFLAAGGKTYGSLSLPRNYPPRADAGSYVVAGFETPGPESNFTAPPELKETLFHTCPEPCFNLEDHWEPDRRDDEAFARNIEAAMRTADQLERLVIHLQRNRPVDVQIAYLQATDILFHKAWRWCDPETRDEHPVRRELVRKFFRRLDQLLARVFFPHGPSPAAVRNSTAPRTLNVLVSDHGHQLSRGRIHVNNLLRDWKWLSPPGSLGRAARRVGLLALKTNDRRSRMREPLLDWSKTRAYLAHVGIYGFVYLNLEGREPEGCVPASQFEAQRDELRQRFLAEKIPGSDKPLFPQVFKGEELYERKEELGLPDLVLVPAPGFFPRKKLTKRPAVKVTPKAPSGVHDRDGVYAFSGPGVACDVGLDESKRAELADLTPTLLAALGLPVPAGLDGRVLDFVFSTPPKVVARDALPKPEKPKDHAGEGEKEVYSEAEQAAVERRLRKLGYLE